LQIKKNPIGDTGGISRAGKSVTLRILAERLGGQRDVKIGILSRPQAGLADFYCEMGDLFGVELAPHDKVGRCQGAARSLADVLECYFGPLDDAESVHGDKHLVIS
jgi:hypothetical protein